MPTMLQMRPPDSLDSFCGLRAGTQTAVVFAAGISLALLLQIADAWHAVPRLVLAPHL